MAPPPAHPDFPRFTPAAITRFIVFLFVIELGFAAAHVVAVGFTQSQTLHALFDLDREHNLPTWFSSMQLFLIGCILALLAPALVGRDGVSSFFLIFLGAGFIFLSADEMVGLHERVTAQFRHVSWMPRFPGGHGIWIPVYGAIGLIVAVFSLRPAWTLWRKRRRACLTGLVGLAVFGAGAVGLEIVSYVFHLRDGSPWLYMGQVIAEEVCEMAGATILLLAVIQLVTTRTTSGATVSVQTAIGATVA